MLGSSRACSTMLKRPQRVCVLPAAGNWQIRWPQLKQNYFLAKSRWVMAISKRSWPPIRNGELPIPKSRKLKSKSARFNSRPYQNGRASIRKKILKAPRLLDLPFHRYLLNRSISPRTKMSRFRSSFRRAISFNTLTPVLVRYKLPRNGRPSK